MIIVLKMKQGDVYVHARDAREEERAYLFLFKMASDNEYYSHDGCLAGDEVAAHAAAKEGSGRAAKWLMNRRNNRRCEYETLDFIYPKVP